MLEAGKMRVEAVAWVAFIMSSSNIHKENYRRTSGVSVPGHDERLVETAVA